MPALRRRVREAVIGPVGARVVRALGREPLLALGDSHLRPLAAVRRGGLLPRTVITDVVVSGASATGIANEHSETQAMRRFVAATDRVGRDVRVLTSLGEVDVGFLVHVRADRMGGTPEDHADIAFDRYTAFLSERILGRGVRLLVLSATPPTVLDYASWGDRENQRRLLTARWEERAETTRRWNERLGRWCSETGADWLDLTPHVTEPGSMRVRPEWLHPDGNDQHLNPARHAVLLADLLRERGFR